MIIQIENVEYHVDDTDFRLCRDVVNTFLEVVRRSSIAKDNAALYVTMLLVLFQKSTELLSSISDVDCKEILSAKYEATAHIENAENVGE